MDFAITKTEVIFIFCEDLARAMYGKLGFDKILLGSLNNLVMCVLQEQMEFKKPSRTCRILIRPHWDFKIILWRSFKNSVYKNIILQDFGKILLRSCKILLLSAHWKFLQNLQTIFSRSFKSKFIAKVKDLGRSFEFKR